MFRKVVHNASWVPSPTECTFYDAYCKRQRGEMELDSYKRISINNCLVNRLIKLSVVAEMPSPDTRQLVKVTAFAWSSSRRNLFAFGNKIGQLYLNKSSGKEWCTHFLPRQSIGGIAGIAFDKNADVFVVTTVGNVGLSDFETGLTLTLLRSEQEADDFGRSIAVSEYQGGLIAVGDNEGELTLISGKRGGGLVERNKIHQGAIKSVEFSNHGGGVLLATASTDKTALVWDIRMMEHPLNTFFHTNPVSSARFSKTNASSLMTTDRNSDINIFDLATSRHMTRPTTEQKHFWDPPNIATWHPLGDLIVTGNYTSRRSNWIKFQFWNPRYKSGMTTVRVLYTPWRRDCTSPILLMNEFSPDGENLAAITENSVIVFGFKYGDDEKSLLKRIL